jgi:4-hydroxybenzoate polyprenyltransferase
VSALPPILRLLRPQQSVKNLAAFAGVIFGGRITEPGSILLDSLVAVMFVVASSATYVFNDLRDVEYDRQHPLRRHRPLAAGEVDRGTAMRLAATLACVAVLLALALGGSTLLCLALYLAINIAYSSGLKHVPLLDVSCIAMGYVLRVLAGIYVLGDMPTAWITLCTFFLALFLGFSKRRSELVSIIAPLGDTRPVLLGYRRETLDTLLNNSAIMAVMSYAMFTATSGKSPTLIVTVPIVYYAIMHYTRLVLQEDRGEEPDQILLRDRTIQISIALWLACFILIFYGHVVLFR